MAPSKNQERDAREARDRLQRYNARQAVHSRQVRRRKRDNLFAVGAVLVVIALAAVAQVFYFSSGPGAPTPEPSSSASSAPAGVNVGAVPDPAVSEYRSWTGQLALNGIPLTLELDGAAAPQAVAAFVTDVNDGYFIGKTCHRLVQDASAGLIQCGSENGDGESDPSVYAYGPVENAPADGKYVSGTIAIANNGSPYGQGHQFFIVFDESLLPGEATGGYSVVGKVTMGVDELKAQIVSGGLTAIDPASPTDGTPNIPTTITAATIQ